jgi:hypothetical protein
VYVTGLTVLKDYTISVTSHNIRGNSKKGSITGSPKEIPNAPNAVSVVSISGTQLQVFWSPPSGETSDITSYTVQWDANSNFTDVISGSPTCVTSGYGSCKIQGSALDVVPPYKYIINFLTVNTKYYVRVSANNAISALINTTSAYGDPTKWSQVVSAVTANQIPSVPVLVEAFVASPTSLQILITPPTTDGGLSLVAYVLEWSASFNFDDVTTSGSVTVAPSDIPVLQGSTGILIYEIIGLTSGVSYWVRVRASNSIGSGPWAIISNSVIPAGKPASPSSISVFTPTTSSSPITSATVSWTAPSSNFGSAISGYLVEWWQGDAIPEIQVVQYTSTAYPSIGSGEFTLSFGPYPGVVESTGTLSYYSDSWNVRSELINLGYTIGSTSNFSYNFVLGDVRVSKSSIPNKGVQWKITFSENQGDQVMLAALPSAAIPAESVNVYELQKGKRAGGMKETQIISIMVIGVNSTDVLGGYFRLSFNGTLEQSVYLPVTATSAQVEQALAELSKMRRVSVQKSVVSDVLANTANYAGFQWTVTFSDIGDQPAIEIDPSFLFTEKGILSVNVFDGDNIMASDGTKEHDTYPGEAPHNYQVRRVSADTFSYSLSNLVPGQTYFVSVSAINGYGIGSSAPTVPSITPPLQAPQPPTNVVLDVTPNSASSLSITYDAPRSDGGSEILQYRVELDVTDRFLKPITTVIPCPTSNVKTVFQIQTESDDSDPIVGGYFNLTISRNRVTFFTDYIPYDATASLDDEPGVVEIVSGITAVVTSNQITVSASQDATQYIFPGDRLQFDSQRFTQEIFTVISVVNSVITLDKTLKLDSSSTGTSLIYRVYGGRGDPSSSLVSCTVNPALCPPDRRRISGSMQGKFESIPEMLVKGVQVERVGPDLNNGFIWRVTFLDDSYKGSLDFDVSLTANSNEVTTLSGRAANISVINLNSGITYETCTGTFVVPENAVLSMGKQYYARVFAVNEIGYSLPQVAPSPQKPMVVPGAPTSVTLSVVSESELRVVFNPPRDDGGDDITQYKIEYSQSASFSNPNVVYVKYLDGGAPFQKTLTGLSQGTFYFVRVSACNSQGCGTITPTVPPSLNPFQSSSAPSNVVLFVTSDTMLTVGFAPPLDNGGDRVTQYRVEWDTVATFNSLSTAPNKGFVDLDASQFTSYTLTYLTAGQRYYVRVFAKNSAGLGTPALASPTYAAPSLQVPGKPHTISAVTASLSGSLAVSWLRPSIPWHGIPCSGTVTNPLPCPSAVGGGLPQSDGGSAITEYEISYNDLEDFSGRDAGKFTTSGSSSLYTARGLTPGRRYYVRVLARNSRGAGQYCRFKEANCLVVSSSVSAYAAN